MSSNIICSCDSFFVVVVVNNNVITHQFPLYEKKRTGLFGKYLMFQKNEDMDLKLNEGV